MDMRHGTFVNLRRKAPFYAAWLCAAFMLGVLPLLFNDAFFDINRFKVHAVYKFIPVCSGLFAIARLISGIRPLKMLFTAKTRFPFISLALFLLACVISCALAGFSEAVLTGNEGRYCGLFFILCCGLAFLMITNGAVSCDVLTVFLVFCASICAILGLINAMGIDPLGFYQRIRAGQEQIFLSTIGHVDFFGTFLTMMLPLAIGMYVFERRPFMRLAGMFGAIAMIFGACSARTDSAFLAMHLACFALTAISGHSHMCMARALSIWSLCFAALPLTRLLLSVSPYNPRFTGLLLILCEKKIAVLLAVVLAISALFLVFAEKRGIAAPGRKRTVAAALILFLLLVFILLGCIVYFTVWDTQADLGEAASFLRFNDEWGSLRGAVYIRSLRAYSDFSLTQKLFGCGLDTTLSILTPYFDDPAILVSGVFNDAHCQPLQLLLTCGLFGSLAFAIFYLSMMISVYRSMKNDSLLCGIEGSLCAYLVIMLLNVTQPILIAAYFSLCALAIARIHYTDIDEGGQ